MARLCESLLSLAMAVALAIVMALLWRDALAIPLQVPLDPNEGWNAYHALAAIGGRALYPHAPDLMANNYPPLSFYLVGAIGTLTGDAIVAGRLISLASFLVIAVALIALLRQWRAGWAASLFASLAFAANLLIASNYVAMNDPQLLGHALQILGLLLVARRDPMPIGGALLMAAGLFVKHNLVALPLAATLWLIGQDWKAWTRFVLTGLAAGLIGLGVIRIFGINLLAEIFSPRLLAFANFQLAALQFLAWAALPILVSIWLLWRYPPDRWMRLAIPYAVIAIALGGFFAAGDGVDTNVFFDTTIALGLTGGLAVARFAPSGRLFAALAYLAPLAVLLVVDFHDRNFAFQPAFRHQAASDIAFLKRHDGPAICEELALCYWAGKDASVDVFNMGEAFATGARSDRPLIDNISHCRFAAMQFDSLAPFALGAKAHDALLAHYRIDHQNDDGIFLVRNGCAGRGSP